MHGFVQDLVKIWPVLVLPPVMILAVGGGLRLLCGKPEPETDTERRWWQAIK